MSNNHHYTHDLITSLFKNIALNQFTDIGTQQSLLLHILNNAIEEPKILAHELLSSIASASKVISNDKEDEDKHSSKSQLIFLTLENIVFNVYSKLKTSENTKSLDLSPQHHQTSTSYSLANLDSSIQPLHHPKFTAFLQNLLGSQHLFEDLLNTIPKTANQSNFQLIAMQVKNLIATFDYITGQEGIKSDVYTTKRMKFLQYIRLAPERAPVKESIKSINRTIFSENVSNLTKLIAAQKDRQAFQISLLRILHYYRRCASNLKYFSMNSMNGQEVIQNCITAYIESKTQTSKDYLFRENRSSEPLLDLILSYMTFYFLPILRTVDDYLEKYLLPAASLDAAGFFSNFVLNGLQQAKTIIEGFPVEFKEFLKKIYFAINSAEFEDKLAPFAPVKTLIFHRFFFNIEIRGLLHKNSTTDASKKVDPTEFLKAGSYFKDLFYEASLKKYATIPEFMEAYDQLNNLFEEIVTKKKISKSDAHIPNYLKFYVTKPLLRYDYAIVKNAIDQVADELQSDGSDFELEDFGDVPRKPRAKIYNASNDKKEPTDSLTDVDNTTGDGRRGSGKALRKVVDGADFSGSLEEDDYKKIERNGSRNGSYKEESKGAAIKLIKHKASSEEEGVFYDPLNALQTGTKKSGKKTSKEPTSVMSQRKDSATFGRIQPGQERSGLQAAVDYVVQKRLNPDGVH